MSLWHELNTPTQVVILTTATALVLGAGYFGYQAMHPGSTEPAAIVEPVATGEGSVAETTPELEAAAGLPKIDTWRVSQDGEAVVAGLATPGAKVEILIDSNPVASGIADAKGEFAILFTLPPTDGPSLMWLTMTAPDEATMVSDERIALGPIKGPEPVATEPAATETAATETVAEQEAPVALLLNDEGAVVLQGNEPDPVIAANVTIETIAYTPEGDVQVGGRGQAGAPLRLYLDNGEAGMIDVPENGTWLITLADAAPGIYTLRVDQLDKDGKVTSRFETPFKRESRAALAALTEKLAETAVAPDAASTPPSAATLVPDPEPVAAEPAPEPEAVVAVEPAPEPAPVPAPEPAPEPEAVAVAEPEPAAPVVEPEPTVAVTEAAPAVAEPEPTVEVAEAAPTPAPAPQPTAAPAITVTVQPGFTLWGIAEDNYGDGVLYVQLFKANKDQIKDPDLIYPGQVFAVPEEATP